VSVSVGDTTAPSAIRDTGGVVVACHIGQSPGGGGGHCKGRTCTVIATGALASLSHLPTSEGRSAVIGATDFNASARPSTRA
jgi:hypothetical protein